MSFPFSCTHCNIEYSRSIISNEKYDSGGGLFGNPDAVGYQVVTPFVLEGTDGEAILVNRGWVQKKNINPASRPQGQVLWINSSIFLPPYSSYFDPIIILYLILSFDRLRDLWTLWVWFARRKLDSSLSRKIRERRHPFGHIGNNN